MKLLGEPYPIDLSRRRDVVVALREKGGSLLDQLDDRYYHLESTTDLDALMERFAPGA